MPQSSRLACRLRRCTALQIREMYCCSTSRQRHPAYFQPRRLLRQLRPLRARLWRPARSSISHIQNPIREDNEKSSPQFRLFRPHVVPPRQLQTFLWDPLQCVQSRRDTSTGNILFSLPEQSVSEDVQHQAKKKSCRIWGSFVGSTRSALRYRYPSARNDLKPKR